MEVWKLGAGFVVVGFFFFFGYQDEYLFWLFHNACQHRACAFLITVLPACKPGLFKFFKARLPVGKV